MKAKLRRMHRLNGCAGAPLVGKGSRKFPRLARSPSAETGPPFRIEGKIDIAAIRSNSCRRAASAVMASTGPASNTSIAEDQPVSLPLTRHAAIAA
jgi:hypothetical protein